jgi:opacity protein-like surface antigen
MKTLVISAVIATLASASASFAAPVQYKHTAPQAAATQTTTTTDNKADTSNWHADGQLYPHQHHRNEYTG